MTDLLTWSPLNLGRWGGVRVRVHAFMIFWVAVTLLNAAFAKAHPFLPTLGWLSLLLLALAVHEGGHAVAAWWLGAEPDDVRLWPLGNFVGPDRASRSADGFVIALAGLAATTLMVVIASVTVALLGAQVVLFPFGNAEGTGAPISLATSRPVAEFTTAWWIGWFGYLNMVLLVANLIPALPFDGGRMVRSYLAHSSISPAKDGLLPPYLARGVAILLFVGGLVRLLFSAKVDGLTLLTLALLIEVLVRYEAHALEDGGYFEEGEFGYDFSQGYTSLEGSTAKVRPYRESAIKRWRRRRSELRRQRRQAQEAAEEQRMDEILDKLHREGRSALTDEEQLFLVRVSARYRNRHAPE